MSHLALSIDFLQRKPILKHPLEIRQSLFRQPRRHERVAMPSGLVSSDDGIRS